MLIQEQSALDDKLAGCCKKNAVREPRHLVSQSLFFSFAATWYVMFHGYQGLLSARPKACSASAALLATVRIMDSSESGSIMMIIGHIQLVADRLHSLVSQVQCGATNGKRAATRESLSCFAFVTGQCGR